VVSLKFVNASAPFEATAGEQIVTIKGFASVSQIDRDNEIVPDPREFDVDTFMASPTLLMDHKFIKDEFGNDSVAGVVTKAVASYVKSITDDLIEVSSLDGDIPVGTLDRKIAPSLKGGDRGLFITAEVRNPIAISKILGGEMGGLSWRGIARKKTVGVCGTTICNQLKEIDLIEISIVHNQAQRQSTFMVAKTDKGDTRLEPIDFSRTGIYGLRLNKHQYPSRKTVEAYLEAKRLVAKSIEESDDSFVAYTDDREHYQCSKSVAIEMGGIEFIAAPENEQNEIVVTHVGQLNTKPLTEKQMAETQKKLRLFLLNEQGLLTRFPSVKTQVMKSVATSEGEEIEILTLEFPEDVTVVDEPKAETSLVSEEKTEKPSEIDSLVKQVEELKLLIEAASKPAQTEAATEPAKVDPVEEISKQLAESSKRLDDVQAENAKLKDVLQSLIEKYQDQVPAHGARAEQLEKSVGKTDPSAVFGSFIARSFNR